MIQNIAQKFTGNRSTLRAAEHRFIIIALVPTILFYLTVATAILFLHNWMSLLALGSDSLDGNHQAWVIWAIVDTLVPITLGVTGCRLWSEADQYWRS